MADSLRVGIVGGSIAGSATAVLMSRADHEVTVFERSSVELKSRGAGIATTPEVLADMLADVRRHKSPRPLPVVSRQDHRAQLDVEAANVTASLDYARKTLKL